VLSLISIHQTIRPGQERMESARPPAGCYSRKQSMAEANEVGIPIELRLDDVATIESGASGFKIQEWRFSICLSAFQA
jgi:hypothetical protein